MPNVPLKLCGKCKKPKEADVIAQGIPGDTDCCSCGRPESYKESYCEDIIPLAKQGKGVEEICAELGFGVTSWYAWQERHPEFTKAVNRAHELCKAWWLNFGRDNLLTPADQRLAERTYALHMMNRFDWNKKEDVKVSGDLATTLSKIEDRIAPPPANVQPPVQQGQ